MGTPLPNTANPHLSNTLRSLVEWLARQKIPYVIIGGVAVSLLAKPRFTQERLGLLVLPCWRFGLAKHLLEKTLAAQAGE